MDCSVKIRYYIFLRMNKKTFPLILVLIIIGAAFLRVFTFWLPHNNGDQIHHLCRAMKLNAFGIKGYNLKNIDIASDENFFYIFNAPKGQKGTVLTSLEEQGVTYYTQEPLSNTPPAFSFLLMLSHKLFSPHHWYAAVNKNLGTAYIPAYPHTFLSTQFYAAWINFAFSLAFLIVLFYLGKAFFDIRTATIATLLMAVTGTDIVTSQKLWTDEMTAFFTALSILLYWYGKTRGKTILYAASGVCCGIAALTKPSGLFTVFILVIFELLLSRQKNKHPSPHVFFKNPLFIFGAAAFFTCGLWYWRITQLYGCPWYMPYQKDIEKTSWWFQMLQHKSRFGQLAYFFVIMPPFILFYAEAFMTFLKKLFTPARILCLTWFSVFIIFLALIPAKEERYMLPAYPPIALMTAYSIESIRKKINTLSGNTNLGTLLIILVIICSSAWSIFLGLDTVFSNLPYIISTF